jgi:hypothetical protein
VALIRRIRTSSSAEDRQRRERIAREIDLDKVAEIIQRHELEGEVAEIEN